MPALLVALRGFWLPFTHVLSPVGIYASFASCIVSGSHSRTQYQQLSPLVSPSLSPALCALVGGVLVGHCRPCRK